MNGRWHAVSLAAYYLLVIFGGAALKAEYSHVSQYISELNQGLFKVARSSCIRSS